MQNTLTTMNKFEVGKKYWLEKLSGKLSEIDLPRDFTKNHYHKEGNYKISFDKDFIKKLFRISKNNDLSLYVLLLASFKIFLLKLTGQNDIIIASPTYASGNEKSNTCVLLRDYLESDLTFKSLLNKIKQTVSEGYKNQYYSVRKIIKLLNLESNPSLFKIIFMLENIHTKESINKIRADFENDITISFRRKEEELEGLIIYNSKIYREETIQKFFESYLHVISQILSNTNISIREIELCTEIERNKILFDFNCNEAIYEKDKTIHQIFEEQADKYPDNIAVVFNDKQITYKELNETANHVAFELRKKNLLPDTIIGLIIEHSIEMVVGILAILKAGCAYLPIAINTPKERIQYMLADCGVSILLTKKTLIDKIEFEKEIIFLDDDLLYREKNSNIENTLLTSRNLAYVVFTSGSTGKPKGVLIEHKSLMNFVYWRIKEYNHTSNDISLQLLSISLDGFGTNLFPCLLSGGKIVLVSEDNRLDYDHIRDIIKKEKVTNFSVVPSMYRILLNGANKEVFKTFRFVVLAGERADKELIISSNKINPKIKLHNEYGPTENTITTTSYSGMEPGNVSIIGKPIYNNHVYILNKNNNLMPIGIYGELCISGDSLARGYLNRPELTAEKFINNPFSNNPDTRLYKTGDIARYLINGNIEFFGRRDHQVKVRGFRIELEEIDAVLKTHPAVHDAVVLVREDITGYENLIAFIVSSRGNIPTNTELRNFLMLRLPDYMVPTAFVLMDKIPLTQSGKVDRSALANSGKVGNKLEGKSVEPRTSVEQMIARIWVNVLCLERVGINDNFFELGGHSLLVSKAISQMRKLFQVDVPMRRFFETPTVAELAVAIAQKKAEQLDSDKLAQVLTELEQLETK